MSKMWPSIDSKPPTITNTAAYLIFAAALFNLFIPLSEYLPSERAMYIAGPAMVGILSGQIGALAWCLVWGEGAFLRRLCLHWAIGIGLWLSFALGRLALDGPPIDLFLRAFCVLPLVSLAAQAGMWPLRTHFGWRVERTTNQLPAERDRRLSIGDVLLGTVVVALSLGLVRAIPGFPPDEWFPFSVLVVSIAASSLGTLLPTTVIVLRAQTLFSAVTAVFGIATCVPIILLGFLAINGAAGIRQNIFLPFIVAYSFTATIAAPLLVYRAAGYRLTWSRDRPHHR